MARPFLLVEVRIAQANFFLGKLVRSAETPFEFHCYLSAFVAACRSVTYVLQEVMSATPGFERWYAEQQAKMKCSPVAECCVDFGIPVEPKLHFTSLNFESLGQSLSDALEEVTGSCDVTLDGPSGHDNQWLLVREAVWSTELLAGYESLRSQ